MNKFEKTIDQIFQEVCISAFEDGMRNFGLCSSLRHPRNSEKYKPGYFYNSLPFDVKERIKKELRSEHAQNILRSIKEFGHLKPWWELD
jgi:hypothetical protein